jgi:N-acetylmuramoyl-L-alanine amidase
MKIAVVVGHDKNKAGAFSPFIKESEYMYHNEVVSVMSSKFDYYSRPLASGYKSQMEILSKQINPKNYDLVVELHFNAFNKKAQGVETLSFPNNSETKEWGEKFCKIISENYKIPNRGVKHVTKDGNGYWFNKLMNCNTIILEPFFGDEKESLKFKDHEEYACHLENFLLSL